MKQTKNTKHNVQCPIPTEKRLAARIKEATRQHFADLNNRKLNLAEGEYIVVYDTPRLSWYDVCTNEKTMVGFLVVTSQRLVGTSRILNKKTGTRRWDNGKYEEQIHLRQRTLDTKGGMTVIRAQFYLASFTFLALFNLIHWWLS